jgi:hypothetical protein
MQAETAEPYRVRLVVQRTNDSFNANWIEPEGQECAAERLGTRAHTLLEHRQP